MARRRPKAHGRRRLGEHFAEQVRHSPLEAAQAHRQAMLALQFLAYDITVAAVLPEALSPPVAVWRQPARPLRRLVALPAPLDADSCAPYCGCSPTRG